MSIGSLMGGAGRACALVLAVFVLLLAASPALAADLLNCAPDAACATTVWPSSDPVSAVQRLHDAVTKKPGMTVGTLGATGFHATYRNLFFDYTDALDVQIAPDAQSINVRSQALKGRSDLFQRQQALRQFRWLARP